MNIQSMKRHLMQRIETPKMNKKVHVLVGSIEAVVIVVLVVLLGKTWIEKINAEYDSRAMASFAGNAMADRDFCKGNFRIFEAVPLGTEQEDLLRDGVEVVQWTYVSWNKETVEALTKQYNDRLKRLSEKAQRDVASAGDR